MAKTPTQATVNPGTAPTPPASGLAVLAQFKKGSGEAPQYSTLSPVPASATAKYVQSFDERAIMREEPPTISGGPRGNPKYDKVGNFDAPPKRLSAYNDAANMRADNQVLVRATPTAKMAENRLFVLGKLRIYRDEAGENIR